ncbi:Uncharacterised protein [Vibrio cholerae]|nr:Uncharacterised protein [Vibrio cholerae]
MHTVEAKSFPKLDREDQIEGIRLFKDIKVGHKHSCIIVQCNG